ncbi:MAG: sugar phosphate isomerase/epimerase, partial [Verrucomicrobiota bacterium]
ALRNWGETSGREYQLALEEARRRMDLSARLGAEFIVCTPPLEQLGFDALHQGYRDLLQIGREAGTKALLEYISVFPSLNNLPDAVTVLDRCGDAEGALVIDAFHNWNSKTSLEDLRALPLERLAHYHIDDADPDKPALSQLDSDRVMVGDGQIDLHSEIAILKEKGYAGWVSLELFNAELWAQDPLEVAKLGMERLHELLDA